MFILHKFISSKSDIIDDTYDKFKDNSNTLPDNNLKDKFKDNSNTLLNNNSKDDFVELNSNTLSDNNSKDNFVELNSNTLLDNNSKDNFVELNSNTLPDNNSKDNFVELNSNALPDNNSKDNFVELNSNTLPDNNSFTVFEDKMKKVEPFIFEKQMIYDNYKPNYSYIKYNKKTLNINNIDDLRYLFTFQTFKYEILTEIINIKYINRKKIEIEEKIIGEENIKEIVMKDENIKINVMCQLIDMLIELSEYGIGFKNIKIDELSFIINDKMDGIKVYYSCKNHNNIKWNIDEIKDYEYINELNIVDYKFTDKNSLKDFIEKYKYNNNSRLKINIKKEKLKIAIEDYLNLSIELNLTFFELFTLIQLNLDSIYTLKLYSFILKNLYSKNKTTDLDISSNLYKLQYENIETLFIMPIPKIVKENIEKEIISFHNVKKIVKSKKIRYYIKNNNISYDLLNTKVSQFLIKDLLKLY